MEDISKLQPKIIDRPERFYFKRKSKLLTGILRLENENENNSIFKKVNKMIIETNKNLIASCNRNLGMNYTIQEL